SPVGSTNDAHEGSSISRPPPRDIYDVSNAPVTPINPKERVNGVWSGRKQPPKTPKSVSQVSPKPVSQASPKPTSQASPKPAPQASPKPALQASPKPALQASPKPVSPAAPEPASQQESRPKVQSPPEPAPQQAPKPKPQASVTPRKGISSPVACVHYQVSFQIEKGDWVVRLREPDAPKLDEGDTWDGPFQVQDHPRADVENGDTKPTLVKLKIPTDTMADPWTDPKRLVPVHSTAAAADAPARGVLHLSKGTSVFLNLATKPNKSKKDRGMFTVGKLRGKEVHAKGLVKYLVHWAEYPDEDDSWEEAEGIPDEFKEQWEKLHASDGTSAAGKEATDSTPNLGGSGKAAKRGEGTAPEGHQGREGSATKRRRTARAAGL
ncbi:hypothetical protein GP486_007131, partial [Trichoglossum hirsutum]